MKQELTGTLGASPSSAAVPKRAEADAPAIEVAARAIIEAIGEDPTRDGLRETPARVARAFAEMTSGYRADPFEILGTVFEAPTGAPAGDLIIVDGIPFHALCEHHLLPFSGVATVGYIPAGRIVGLSKIPRLVDALARRLQVQERLTAEIAAALESALGPRGVGVLISAEHLCLAARGARQPGVLMTTEALRGSLRDDAATRAELARAHERGLARRGGAHE
jgi:GTP cyclohydrolase I